ncbi:MAG TPA: alpha-L-arabinofuranosidase C-terminal domain-containing protein, partial [Verrucomicrobiae bacterium]
KRALANARAINAIERDGRLPVTTSANCLQPDGENDNGWDQGLLFLNPSQVWFQPPGYVTQMYSAAHQSQQVWSSVVDTNSDLDVSAQSSADGKTLTLKIVNSNGSSKPAAIHLAGFSLMNPIAVVNVLSASLDAANTAQNPTSVKPIQTNWQYQNTNHTVNYTFAPESVTTIVFQGQVAAATATASLSFDGAASSTVVTDSIVARNQKNRKHTSQGRISIYCRYGQPLNPEGIPTSSPRLRRRSYLGDGFTRIHNPIRGCG